MTYLDNTYNSHTKNEVICSFTLCQLVTEKLVLKHEFQANFND